MFQPTPLRQLHEAYVRTRFERRASSAADRPQRPGAASGISVAPSELEWLSYGPPSETGDHGEIVATYGEVELEYAAIRRGVGLLDTPQRSVLTVLGSDRRDFLQRMVTADLRDLTAGVTKRAFWLNRKGRIDADLQLIELGDRMLMIVDAHQAAHTLSTLSAFIITEDVEIRDTTGELYCFSLHGPQAIGLVQTACSDASFMLGENCAAKGVLGGADTAVARDDQTGSVGLHVVAQREKAADAWTALLRVCEDRQYARPIGWYAFNIARIEAGTPLFNIDFGTDSLPHESGVLRDRVSFTKGCYLGQEIVARMESLGQPKQVLIGLAVQSGLLPVAGGQVFALNDRNEMGDQIGVVTSSTLSPMLGAAPICFAVVRTKHAAEGARVLVNAEGEQSQAIVRGLRFLPNEQEARV